MAESKTGRKETGWKKIREKLRETFQEETSVKILVYTIPSVIGAVLLCTWGLAQELSISVFGYDMSMMTTTAMGLTFIIPGLLGRHMMYVTKKITEKIYERFEAQDKILASHTSILTEHTSILSKMSTTLETISGSQKEMAGTLQTISTTLKSIDGKMDRIDGKLDRIDGKLDRIDGKLERIDGRLDGIDGKLDRTNASGD